MSRAVHRHLALPAILGAILLGPPVLADDDRNRRNDRAFFLGGTAEHARDPENPANEVIRIRTDVPPFFGSVSRRLNVKFHQLDNMVEFKAWYMAPKTCIGGSPRIQLAIDLDGDRRTDGNVFLDTGVQGSGAGCPPHTWLYEDLTGGDGITGLGLSPSPPFTTPNEERECAASQLGGPGVPGAGVTWSECEAFFATFPHHVVCSAALIDDTFGIPGMTGTAYYDLISLGNATWNDHNDTASRNRTLTGCERDQGNRDDDDD